VDHCKSIASDLQVQHEVNLKELILKFILEHSNIKSERDAVLYYFNDGKNSANVRGDLVYDYLDVLNENK